jgi:hypothetical protein
MSEDAFILRDVERVAARLVFGLRHAQQAETEARIFKALARELQLARARLTMPKCSRFRWRMTVR